MSIDRINCPQDDAQHIDLTSAETAGAQDSGTDLEAAPAQSFLCRHPWHVNRLYPIQSRKSALEVTPELEQDAFVDEIIFRRDPVAVRALDGIDAMFNAEEEFAMTTPESEVIVAHEDEVLEFTVPQVDESDSDPTPEAVEATDEAVVEPTLETVEATDEAVVEPTLETVEATDEAVVEPTPETVEATDVAVVEPTLETVEATDVAVVEPTLETVEATDEAVVEPMLETVEATDEAAVEPTPETVQAVAALQDPILAEVIVAISEKRNLMVKVTGANNGGVTVQAFGKKNGFVPNSELVKPDSKKELVGKTIGVIADELRDPKKPGKSDLVLSQKHYLKRAVQATKIGDTVEGAIVAGHVRTGVLIDLTDGRQHYLPYSELKEQHANPVESLPIGTVLSPLVALRSDVKKLSVTFSQRWAEVIALKGQTVEIEVKDYQRNSSNDNVSGVLVEICGIQNVFVPRSKVTGNFPGKGDKIVCLIKTVTLSPNPYACKIEVDEVRSLAEKPALLPRRTEERKPSGRALSNDQRGQVFDAIVRKVESTGALVDLRVGGIDIVAELPEAEISDEDSLGARAAKLPAPGQPVKVMLIDAAESSRRPIISLKRAMLANLQPQETINGVVASILTDDGTRTVQIESQGLKLSGKMRAEDCANLQEAQVGSTVKVALHSVLYARTVWFTQKQS